MAHVSGISLPNYLRSYTFYEDLGNSFKAAAVQLPFERGCDGGCYSIICSDVVGVICLVVYSGGSMNTLKEYVAQERYTQGQQLIRVDELLSTLQEAETKRSTLLLGASSRSSLRIARKGKKYLLIGEIYDRLP